MFTGLIETVGTIAELKTTTSGFRLRVRTTLASELTPGDSLAVNGADWTIGDPALGGKSKPSKNRGNRRKARPERAP